MHLSATFFLGGGMSAHGMEFSDELLKRFQDALARRGLGRKIRPGIEAAVKEFIDREGQVLPPGLPEGMDPKEIIVCAEIVDLLRRDEQTKVFILSAIKYFQALKPRQRLGGTPNPRSRYGDHSGVDRARGGPQVHRAVPSQASRRKWLVSFGDCREPIRGGMDGSQSAIERECIP